MVEKWKQKGALSDESTFCSKDGFNAELAKRGEIGIHHIGVGGDWLFSVNR
jgi:hypothetical protein